MYSTQSTQAIATALPKCDRAISYYTPVVSLLTDSRIYEQKLVGHRFFVDVISHSWELQDGYSVPSKHQTLDVVVTEPGEEAIKQLVAGCDWLKDYHVVAYSKAEDNCEF